MVILVTTTELATRCDVSVRTIFRWSGYDGFPGVADKQCFGKTIHDVFDWHAVREWLISTQRWDEVVDRPSGHHFPRTWHGQPTSRWSDE